MFKKVEAYIRHEKLTEVRSALVEIGVPAVDTVEVRGHGRQTGIRLAGRHSSYTVDTLPRIRLAVVVSAERRRTGCSGDPGGGRDWNARRWRHLHLPRGEFSPHQHRRGR